MSYLNLGWSSDQGQATKVDKIGYRKIIGRVFGMKNWNNDGWKDEAKLCPYHDTLNNKTLYPDEIWQQPPWEVWVSYYVKDKSCEPYLGEWQKDFNSKEIGICNDGKKEYKAIVYNIPYSNGDNHDTWGTWGNKIKATINGVQYNPIRSENNGLNLWNTYSVPDKSCDNKFGESDDVGHHITKNIQQVEKLTWSLEDFFTGIFSNKYSFYIIAGILIVGGLVYLKSKT